MPLWSTSWSPVVSYLVSVRGSLPAAWEQSLSPAVFMSQPSKSTRILILTLGPFRLMNMVSNWMRSSSLLCCIWLGGGVLQFQYLTRCDVTACGLVDQQSALSRVPQGKLFLYNRYLLCRWVRHWVSTTHVMINEHRNHVCFVQVKFLFSMTAGR